MHNTLLNLSKTPYWLTDPRLKISSFSAHDENIPTISDIATVGGAATGLSVAITLARAGGKVTVFDAAPFIRECHGLCR
jgi:NADPH-dependent 2,4-dienoyl-CoA reductase/sulfur reductase-like enzyme